MSESGQYNINRTTVRLVSRQRAPEGDFMNREGRGRSGLRLTMIICVPLLAMRADDSANPAVPLSDRDRSRSVVERSTTGRLRRSRPVALQGAKLSSVTV